MIFAPFDWLERLYDKAMKSSRRRATAVAQAQVALGIDPPKVVKTPEELWQVISTNLCPDCGGEGFLEGPSGGMSTNIACATCGHRFNVTPIVGRAERI